MKNLVSIIFVLILMIALQGCSNSPKYNIEKDTSKDTGNSVDKKINYFEQNSYNAISELDKTELNVKVQEFTKKEYYEYISNPVAISNITNDESYIDLISSKDKKIIFHPLKDTNGNKEFDKKKVNYIQLPDKFSNNISYKRLVDNYGTTGFNKAVIIDNDNNLIALLNTNDKGSNKMRIDKAIKLNKELPVKNLEVIYGYSEKEINKVIFKGQDNTIYVVDTSSFRVTKKEEMKEWKTVSAYPYKKIPTQEEWDTIYLYQINENNCIRKYDLNNNKINYERNLSNYPINGNVIKIEYAKANNSLVVLTNYNNSYLLYNIGDEVSPLYNLEFDDLPIRLKDKYDTGTPFGKIDDFFLTNLDIGGGHQGHYIGLIEKSSLNPISFVDIIYDEWTDVNK